MTKRVAENVLSLLQQQPLYYRNFGVWWWHVKAELRRYFGPEHAPVLGARTQAGASLVKRTYAGHSVEDRDRLALEHQEQHIAFSPEDPQSWTPDAQLYYLRDDDGE